MLVARFTLTPEYDVRRNWSGWMGMDFGTELEAYEFVAEQQVENLEEQWEQWQDEEYHTWYHRDHNNRLDFLQDTVSADIRYNEEWERWQVVHHDGLSCWTLESKSVSEAIGEAKNSNLNWYGFGSHTSGKVSYVCPVDGVYALHIFECDETWAEV